jgi:hypothetical protein
MSAQKHPSFTGHFEGRFAGQFAVLGGDNAATVLAAIHHNYVVPRPLPHLHDRYGQ